MSPHTTAASARLDKPPTPTANSIAATLSSRVTTTGIGFCRAAAACIDAAAGFSPVGRSSSWWGRNCPRRNLRVFLGRSTGFGGVGCTADVSMAGIAAILASLSHLDSATTF